MQSSKRENIFLLRGNLLRFKLSAKVSVVSLQKCGILCQKKLKGLTANKGVKMCVPACVPACVCVCVTIQQQ